ncbi:MAG: MBL fold metallo-hydrolase [Actinomycetota bacterium]|nr:MBL fold metallo-hydrolase [Actinomycetota bacterium]
MQIRIRILCENQASGAFKGEHGFSALIEMGGKSLVFDSGQSDTILQNALISGVNLREIDGIALSHGHFDHSGGLLSLLDVSGPKKVYLHSHALEPKYFISGKVKRFIGTPFTRDALESLSRELVFTKDMLEIIPGLHLSGEIPRVNDPDYREETLFREIKGNIEPDPFTDDQSIFIEGPEGVIVITGCAHAGLINIISYAEDAFGKISAIVGGMHLGMGMSTEKINESLDYIESVCPLRIVPCHCTGLKATARMLERFKNRTIPGHAGLLLCF